MVNAGRFLSAFLVAGVFLAPASAQADSAAGAYLAARQAGIASDFSEGAKYFAKAVSNDPSNIPLLESALITMLGKNDADQVERIVGLVSDNEGQSRIVDLARYAIAVRDAEFGVIPKWSGDVNGIDDLFDGLLSAWAQLGAGDAATAETIFAKVAKNKDFASFARFQEGLAKAMVGDFERAQQIFSGDAYGPLILSSRGIVAHAQILMQLERRDDAVDLLEQAIGNSSSPELTALLAQIKNNEAITYDFVTTPQQGTAELYTSLAQILIGRANPATVLIYVRLANMIAPDNTEARLMSAEMLGDLDQHGLATTAYAAVPTDDPMYVRAEIGRAFALYNDDRKDAAVEVLDALTRANISEPLAFSSLGEISARLEKNQQAITAYTTAIELSQPVQPNAWSIFYRRGILHEQLGEFEAMETDFRKALELQPDQPDVLNYLGYSLVEQRVKLDEALAMIETAVRERPESGYIADSLGWIFYRLDRFEDAVEPMERAIRLEPVDPIINDHLGDVYSKVGRLREAEFQWKRALSFEPEPAEADRIKRKLEVGLDAVLAEEAKAGITQTADD